MVEDIKSDTELAFDLFVLEEEAKFELYKEAHLQQEEDEFYNYNDEE